MTITNIKIRKIFDNDDSRLKALVSLTFDDSFALHDIKVIDGDNRLFVAMPSRRDETGIFRDIAHPISTDVRDTIEQAILDEYLRYIQTSEVNAD